jgi:hypothetical protein
MQCTDSKGKSYYFGLHLSHDFIKNHYILKFALWKSSGEQDTEENWERIRINFQHVILISSDDD